MSVRSPSIPSGLQAAEQPCVICWQPKCPRQLLHAPAAGLGPDPGFCTPGDFTASCVGPAYPCSPAQPDPAGAQVRPWRLACTSQCAARPTSAPSRRSWTSSSAARPAARCACLLGTRCRARSPTPPSTCWQLRTLASSPTGEPVAPLPAGPAAPATAAVQARVLLLRFPGPVLTWPLPAVAPRQAGRGRCDLHAQVCGGGGLGHRPQSGQGCGHEVPPCFCCLRRPCWTQVHAADCA